MTQRPINPVMLDRAVDAALRAGFTPSPLSLSMMRPWNDASPASQQIDLYGTIGVDVTASAFRDALVNDVETINLHVNSPGGDVYEAVAILNTLRAHPARVVVTVDSLAASAAGFIAIGAADELYMAENSELMAHLPMAGATGNANDIRRVAADLDRVANNIASIFATRAGGTVADWLDVLAAETWWSAQEAVDAGLADGIADRVAVTNSYDLSVFAHAGRASAPPPRIVAHTRPLPTLAEASQKEGDMPTLKEGLAKLLGVDADADEAAILTAAESALTREEPLPLEPAEPSLETVTAVAAKSGLTLVSNEALTALQDQARKGAEARAQQVREAHERTVNQAIEQGRIAPARREHWLGQLAADPEGITNVIAGLPAVIPLNEIGHGVSNEASTDDEAFYAAITRKEGE